MRPLPAIYLPHGGGPCFFMDWDPPHMWDPMAEYLRALPALIGQKPKAIVVISAHWEAPEFTIQTGLTPPLYFDYGGFPPHTYELTWPAQNSEPLIARVSELIKSTGIRLNTDSERGYDHGVFIPLKVAFPDNDVPVLQISLKTGLDPEAHLALGRALPPLRDEGVLLIGSGISFHHMRHFFQPIEGGRNGSHAFDDWLQATIKAPREAREMALQNWGQAPFARACHPREEHLIPLMIMAGAAGDSRGSIPYHQDSLGQLNVAISAVHFGENA